MKKSLKLISSLGVAVLLLGLPSVLLTHRTDTPSEPAAEQASEPFDEVLASRSVLTDMYHDWKTRYVEHGGDRNVLIRLGHARWVSTETSDASGSAELDLIAGRVEVHVPALAEEAAVWLIDNQPGPDKSFLPEQGDRMVRLGRLDTDGRLGLSLGDGFFDTFELDLVVVSRRGQSPVDSRVLLGSRPYFERLYTKARAARTASRPSSGPLGRFAGLVSSLAPRTAEASSSSVLVSHNLISQQVADGGDLFFDGTFNGNGRTCGTCHPAENNQVIEVDFIETLPAGDKLFVAEHDPANGGVPGLEVPDLMRGFGLILENVDGAEDPTNKFVMRGVPHSLSMSTSVLAPDDGRAPVERTGWSGDGAPQTGSLRFFSAGAVFQHFTKSLKRNEGTDFDAPTDSQLDDMEAFMLAAGRTNDLADISQITLNEAAAARGLDVFTGAGKCNNCHGNAGANSLFSGANSNFNTGIELLHNQAQDVVDHPADGGFGKTPAQDTDGDGVDDLFGDGTFNTTPLVEAADTGPFFHNNTVSGIENAVAFYAGQEFNSTDIAGAIGGISLTLQEIDDVGALLRVLNASFNLDQAIQRIDAAADLENNNTTLSKSTTLSTESTEETNGTRETANKLLQLANVENDDAVGVLDPRGLNPTAVSDIKTAIDQVNKALLSNKSKERKQLMLDAISSLDSAKADLGSGMDFVIGEGNLMF